VTIDLTANDSEQGGNIDPASLLIVTQPAHGGVSVNGGSVVYTPSAGYSGSDTFTYRVSDIQGAMSNVATVTMSVTAAASSSGGGAGAGGGGGGGGATSLADLLGIGGVLLMSMASRTVCRRRPPEADRTPIDREPELTAI
jgi:hypothetical protein